MFPLVCCSRAVFEQTYLPFLVKDVAMELAVPLFGLAVGYKVHHGLFSRRGGVAFTHGIVSEDRGTHNNNKNVAVSRGHSCKRSSKVAFGN